MLTELTGRPVLGVLPCSTGPLARRRGLARLRAGARPAGARRAAANGCGSRWSACRGSPTPPTPRRSPPSRACRCGSRSSRPSSPTPTWSCCPAPSPPSTTWRWLRETGPGRRGAGPRRGGPAGARHLRRLPDARPSASTTTWRAAAATVAGAGPAAGRGHVRRRGRRSARPTGRGARAQPVGGYEIHHGQVRRRGRGPATVDPAAPTARARARWSATCSARTGTGRSSPTGSGGRS